MRGFFRWVLCLLVAGLALQLFFVARIAAMAVIDPQSTAFQRSEAWQIAVHGRTNTGNAASGWKQEWVPYDRIADTLKRAVIASEDAEFVYHQGVEWEAIERARQRNAKAEEIAARRAAQARARGKEPAPAKIRGGSTITQQLAKNLLLTGERTLLRKGQELVLATLLELLLSKERILEIYLNNVEWGEGVFGAEAAAQHYFGKPAARLSANEAARLAVMLPSPKFFERRAGSPYLSARAGTITARMPAVDLP
ncbi:monofunctional biosynthetic peptidoglycan transglycosylase [Variovorax ginsengisoli]|uniref:Biosynthetic peptidoglycan transglycosylase n=1 Tax=Variovorax ginsengisoli TaxID=363844 RepID=A0ABT9SEA2_9BURK|nr:monofunctional biosynthetic peptidoglycan transglycosylase [Variovorax ginsengisoli]MDP9901712.1 monofunctional biosynthetic peptidoglycan transglycosylase [Variovorax ginsengisoli]